MCFSIAIDKNINKLSHYFGAQLSVQNKKTVQKLLTAQNEMPSEEFEKLFGLKRTTKKQTAFKMPNEDGKIFPNYFAPVIIDNNNIRVVEEMRYRIRPAGSKEEVPTKFNLYNARLDSLLERKTWQSLIRKNHGIVPFVKFFEWVPGFNNKPKLISFFPEKHEIMWAPCLWDEWTTKNGQLSFKSFAIITDGPPPEIEKMGHDRCPIFLKEELIEAWLNPKNKSIEEVLKILKHKEEVQYNYAWV